MFSLFESEVALLDKVVSANLGPIARREPILEGGHEGVQEVSVEEGAFEAAAEVVLAL